MHPDDVELVRETWRRSVQEGTPFELEYRLQHPDGQVRWATGRNTELYDEQGALRGLRRQQPGRDGAPRRR